MNIYEFVVPVAGQRPRYVMVFASTPKAAYKVFEREQPGVAHRLGPVSPLLVEAGADEALARDYGCINVKQEAGNE